MSVETPQVAPKKKKAGDITKFKMEKDAPDRKDVTPPLEETRKNYRRLPSYIGKLVTKVHDTVDPVSFMGSLGSTAKGVVRNPLRGLAANTSFLAGISSASHASFYRMIGEMLPGPMEVEKGDYRFKDPTWEYNAFYYYIQQLYLLSSQYGVDLVTAANLEGPVQKKAEFSVKMFASALAPTNFLQTNPAAIHKAFETGGLSVARGLRNRMRDMVENNGWPRMVDDTKFKVGENMGITPGKVVYRNDLIELIQYEPQTDKVLEVPLLYNPAWINRYYIMDLAPGKSFIEWAVQKGHTVFAISYRNPDETMGDVSFSDYLIDGPLEAVKVIREITKAAKVNLLGVCLGGTLTASLVAYLNEIGDDSINSATFLNSHIDFSIPGVLGVFADEDTISSLERRMVAKGYASGDEFSRTFNLIRSQDLIWQYVHSGWLMGEDPPSFDLLAWNGDNTKLPAKMHSYYLRKCYVENALAQDKMVLAGKRLKITEIKQDIYVVGAIADHIVPWHSSYKSTQVYGGDVRYVLSSSGHIAGMVNPPSPKASYWVNTESYPVDPDEWFNGATKHQETWWEDWVRWTKERSGKLVAPPTTGSKKHAVICDAPGRYVTE